MLFRSIDNVGKFGFKISYPEQGTLRSPEPWHIMYVGTNKKDDNKNKVAQTDYNNLSKKISEIQIPLEVKSNEFNEDLENIQKSLVSLDYLNSEKIRYGYYDENTKEAIQKFNDEFSLDSSNLDDITSDDTFTSILKFLLGVNESLGSPISKLQIVPGSGFRSKERPSHPGTDYAINSGSDVKSPDDGKVIDSETRNDACGGTLFIDHENGFKSRYCHMKRIDVKKGDKVTKGQIIGLTGGGLQDYGKGNSSGPHLHFELYKDGQLVDPSKYLDEKTFDSNGSSGTVVIVDITEKFLKKLIEKLKEIQ